MHLTMLYKINKRKDIEINIEIILIKLNLDLLTIHCV